MLTREIGDDGSAVVESVFGILLVMTLVLGVVQVALGLYARNVVAAAAHEGARAAIELGGTEEDASFIARRTVESSAGGVTRDLTVEAVSGRIEGRIAVRVRVEAILEPFGPIPVSFPVTSSATSSRASR
jgi:Flp pilus assembly protein TadG